MKLVFRLVFKTSNGWVKSRAVGSIPTPSAITGKDLRHLVIVNKADSLELNIMSKESKNKKMYIRGIIGAVIGAVIGGVIGYFGKCSGSTWGMTANPWSGIIFGALIGFMLASSQ